MFHVFRVIVIGGRTGKRESAWFAFVLWTVWTIVLIYVEATGGPSMDGSRGMWSMTTPFVFTWLAAAHGFEWVSTQTRWGIVREADEES
jgi:hypothetical protein